MRQGRSSSKHETNSKGMEIDKVSCSTTSSTKLKEEPHLSGAYIRSLVKQLTSSKTKDSMNINPKDPDSCLVVVDGNNHHDGFPGQNLTKLGEGLSETQQQTEQTQQPQQHKKQVRRRLHTSRPYQERLLNMAEARREIVTALKFHRAAMKQANEQQQQQQQQEHQDQQQQPPPPPPPQAPPQAQPLQPPLHFEQQEGKIKSRRNHRIYPSNTSTFSNYLDNLSYSSIFPPPPPNPSFWPANSPVSTLPFGGDQNLNFTLPNQALGLNLNFHDFNNIDTASLYHHNPSFYSTSASASSPSSSSSPSPSISVANDHDPHGSAAMAGPAAASSADNFVDSSAATSGGGGLHAAMDDEEMAEIRSLGEQHQMEWNDTMNLVTSAYWLKFLKADDDDDDDDDNGFQYPFDDQVMEFPAWLSSNESCFQQQHFDDYYCSDDYFQSPALPCMDIGEIEAMDGDWLA